MNIIPMSCGEHKSQLPNGNFLTELFDDGKLVMRIIRTTENKECDENIVEFCYPDTPHESYVNTIVNGKVVKQTYGDGRFTRFLYDENGQTIAQCHSDGGWEMWTRDEKGRIVFNDHWGEVEIIFDDEDKVAYHNFKDGKKHIYAQNSTWSLELNEQGEPECYIERGGYNQWGEYDDELVVFLWNKGAVTGTRQHQHKFFTL